MLPKNPCAGPLSCYTLYAGEGRSARSFAPVLSHPHSPAPIRPRQLGLHGRGARSCRRIVRWLERSGARAFEAVDGRPRRSEGILPLSARRCNLIAHGHQRFCALSKASHSIYCFIGDFELLKLFMTTTSDNSVASMTAVMHSPPPRTSKMIRGRSAFDVGSCTLRRRGQYKAPHVCCSRLAVAMFVAFGEILCRSATRLCCRSPARNRSCRPVGEFHLRRHKEAIDAGVPPFN